MQSIQENKMGIRPIPTLVLSMSFPIMISMMIQALYNVVDSIFLAQYSETALTAVSLAFPMQNLLIAVAVGTSLGVNSLLARKLGAKDYEGAEKAANNGLTLSFFSWILFAVIGLFFSKTFFAFFTEDAALLKMGTQYVTICFFFSLAIFVDITCERILQATGDTVHPMIIQSSGAIVNIILDPILIFGLFGFPSMGVLGAAIATVIGQHVAAFLAIYYVRKNKEVKIRKKYFKLEKRTVIDIYAVGLPSIIMQAIGTIMTTSLNKLLISFGTAAVSVFGVYFRLQSFVFMPIFGLNSGMTPILGYNYGAKRPKRMMETIRVGLIISFFIMTAGFAVFIFFPGTLLSWFNASDEMLAIGKVALPRISLCFISAGIAISLSALFQAVGDGYISMLISITRQLVFLLPIAYLLGHFLGLDALWYAFIIAEGSSLALSLFFFARVYKKRVKPLYDTIQ
ncbi:MAG TPA: MATE family efflux transporter [Sphaerochaeta sp.]|nr:MATE family efflux transporter [Sphaerochaeta sp.]